MSVIGLFDSMLDRMAFWRSAFYAAWTRAKQKHSDIAELRRANWDCSRGWSRTAARLNSVEESYCDAALQLLALDREQQLLKLRSSTQLNAEYEMRNLFDGCGVFNWPVHSGRIANQSKRVQKLRDFGGDQKAIDV